MCAWARVEVHGSELKDSAFELLEPARHLAGRVREHVPVLFSRTSYLEAKALTRKDVGDTDNGVCTKGDRFEQRVLRV